MRVLTLATLGTLAQARTLGRSLSRHQPDWRHEIVLLAAERAISKLARQQEPSLLRGVEQELELQLEPLLALHDEQELATLVLPSLLLGASERSGEPVLHLPASAWALCELSAIEAAVSARGVVLVPRSSDELPDDGLEPSAAELERAGRIEQTLMGIEPGARGEAFLAWWGERVEAMLGSLDARRAGARPEDRAWLARYLELAPARFHAAVLDDPGWNLSMWNAQRHRLEAGPAQERVLLDGRWALRLLNLPGFDPEHPHRLGPTASRARVSRAPVLHDLCERYAGELRQSGWGDIDHHAEVGRMLDDQLVYDESLRALYASALALGEPVGELFSDEGRRAFVDWLGSPAPRGAVHGITRYVLHRVGRERPDVVRAYPDLDGQDGAGFLAWCRAFGGEELAIPGRFMPPGSQGAGASAPTASEAELASVPPARAPARAGGAARPGPVAVRLSGYLGHTLGLGAAARGYAQALSAAGVPVQTVSVPLHHLALPAELAQEYGRHGFEDLVHDTAHGFEVIAVNADELPGFIERVGEDHLQGPRIGIWGWETNTIPPRWQRAFALVDEIWVYSRFMAENIGAVAPVPVIALPPPVQAPREPPAPLRLGVPEGFLFLFVFDYLSTIQRKNPVGLIEAFRSAFAAGEGPRLLIKTINAPLRPLAEEEVLWAAHGREDIHVIDRSLGAGELAGLMAACDCYVSLHRAEGFGLTMAEAMALGKPVIGTGYSGNVDFMNAANSYLVDYSITRVGPECEIYPPEGEWADPSLEHAATLMRAVRDDPEGAARIAGRASEDIARTLSPQARGSAMRERLEQLAAGATGPATGA